MPFSKLPTARRRRPIPLDTPHLRAGTFTYARQTEKVDVKLIVASI